MIKYDLIYVIYVNGTYIYLSDRREYTERMEHVEVLQMKHGQRRDKYLRQQREQRPGFRHLRYERSRLYLANPDFDLDYALNGNADDIMRLSFMRLNLNESVGGIHLICNQRFGAARKPLVVLQMSYVK